VLLKLSKPFWLCGCVGFRYVVYWLYVAVSTNMYYWLCQDNGVFIAVSADLVRSEGHNNRKKTRVLTVE
jgi:hypothetical protein